MSTSNNQQNTIIESTDVINSRESDIVASVIVSVYNAERYIAGCLEDLLSQSIADKLEIIVVDSGSEQDEGTIVREYQQHHGNINYLRTGQRETVYAAWNRGIQLASGRYISNANADDRHRRDAFEIMAGTLDQRPDIALVYADLLITETENETFERCTPTGRFGWLDWDRQKLLEGNCFMGPQPMWRRTLHEEYGYFRSDFVTSGDYEFWLRVSQTHDFLHLPVVLGLYLKSASSIEHANREAQRRENLQILREYRSAAEKGIVLHQKLSGDVYASRPDIRPPQRATFSPIETLNKAWDAYWRSNRGSVLERLGKIDFSQRDTAALITSAATLYMELGEYREALNLITQSGQKSLPPEWAALKVFALLGMADIEMAVETLRIALNEHPKSAALHNAKGLLHLEMAEYVQSIQSFETVTTSIPDNADAHINLGMAYLQQGDPSGAITAAKKGFLITNPFHSNIIKMAKILESAVSIQAIDRLQIDRMYTTLIGAYPHNKVLIYQYISDLLAQGRDARALDFMEMAIVRFGYDDGILQHGVSVRAKIGPMRLENGSRSAGSLSLCALVGANCPSLEKRLAALKGQVQEIVAVSIGATEEVLQIAKTFGAQVYHIDDYPLVKSPWDLATQMAVGEQCLRVDLRSGKSGELA